MTVCKVKQGKDGVWYARPYLGRTPDGKPIQPYKQFDTAKTEAEAQDMADAWAANLTADGLVRSALLADLLDDYAAMRRRNGASPNSTRSYGTFTRYVRKYLTTANARDLRVYDFNRFEQRLMMPKEMGGQGLSRNSVRNVHDFLRGAYRFFVRAGICESNPLINVDKPTPERHEAQALAVGDFQVLDAQLKTLLSPQELDADSYRKALDSFAAWLALRTGMRVGEVCAVRDRDVYRAAKYIHVGGNVIEEKGKRPYRRDVTKGRKCRNIAITDTDIHTIDAFVELRERFCGALGAASPLVTYDGGFERPCVVSRAFTTLASNLAMPQGFTFHDLRHTHATWLLTHGVDLKTVSERLGHADEATTLRIYAHVLPGRDAYAASVFEQAAQDASTKLSAVLQ
ncbi:tyrosine-type recombinase/integrase [Adlercreutzia sp. ZJ141]|uniref:tyrosine-type recombinase/integrase n=1 Tax=Adlercreutzia sp. ZJ141 TaxID=2709406 RepID=UPI0013EBD2DE|nr:site-specific integrase [Adlercreutzia sp. ZJ141]